MNQLRRLSLFLATALSTAAVACTVGEEEVDPQDAQAAAQEAADAWLDDHSVDGVVRTPGSEGDSAYGASCEGETSFSRLGWSGQYWIHQVWTCDHDSGEGRLCTGWSYSRSTDVEDSRDRDCYETICSCDWVGGS